MILLVTGCYSPDGKELPVFTWAPSATTAAAASRTLVRIPATTRFSIGHRRGLVSRHECFRRLLCARIGRWVEDGEYPLDEDALAHLVRDICYYNAKTYFRFATT